MARGRGWAAGRVVTGTVAVLVVLAVGGLLAVSRAVAPVADASPVAAPAAGRLVPGPEGLTAVAVQTRFDQADGGRFQVRMTNLAERPVTVQRLALDSAGFAPLPPTAQDVTLQPRGTVDLPIPYGELDCTVEPAEFTVAADVVPAGAPSRRVTLVLRPTDDVLGKLHRYECGQRLLAEAVTVRLAGPWSAGVSGDRPSLRTTLVVERRASEEPITVTSVGGNVLYELGTVDTPLPVLLGPADGEVTMPVEVTVPSCNGHVLGEVKKAYVFPVFLAIGDREPQYTEAPVGEADQAVLYRLVGDTCATADDRSR